MGAVFSRRRTDVQNKLSKTELKVLKKTFVYHIQPIAGSFFFRSVEVALSRSPAVRQTLGLLTRNFDPECARKDSQICNNLSQLSDKMMRFTKEIMDLLWSGEDAQAADKSRQLGARHISFGLRQYRFQPVFWDIFVVSMTETLEKEAGVKPNEIYTWQKFIRAIVDWMREGYDEEKTKTDSRRSSEIIIEE